MNYDFTSLKDFLNSSIPEFQEDIWTFFDIAGVGYKETALSNVYAYYLSQSYNHGLEGVFMKALYRVVSQKDNKKSHLLDDWFEWEATTEISVGNGRIDILLEETSREEHSFVIIENKLFASLNNPLEDYWSCTDSEKKLGIVMSLQPMKTNHNGFINITHKEYIHEVQQMLSNKLLEISERDLLIIKDLIININYHSPMENSNKEIFKFYDKEREKIKAVCELRDEVRNEFLNAVNYLAENVMKSELLYKKAKNYRMIIDKENKGIQLQFFFEYDYKDKPIAIALYGYGYLERNKNKILGKKTYFGKHKKLGLECDMEAEEGSWFNILSKYYSLSDLEYNPKNIEKIYLEEWQPAIEDLKLIVNKIKK